MQRFPGDVSYSRFCEETSHRLFETSLCLRNARGSEKNGGNMIRNHPATQYFFPRTPRTRSNTAKIKKNRTPCGKSSSHRCDSWRKETEKKKKERVLQSEQKKPASVTLRKGRKKQPTAGGKQESQTLNETESSAFATAVRRRASGRGEPKSLPKAAQTFRWLLPE